jgi:hypothetical protein
MAGEVTAIVTTGIFTLAGVLGGATLSRISALRMARQNAERQEVQELRPERIRTYASFLQATAVLETRADHLSRALRLEATADLEEARAAASSSSDRALHALSELELFAGDQVLAKARTLSRLVQKNYRLMCEGRERLVSTAGARSATTAAMQVELGIAGRTETTPPAKPEYAPQVVDR